MNIHSLKSVDILVVPRELKKREPFSQETYHSHDFRYETLKSSLLKKTNSLISCEGHERLKLPFCYYHSSQQNE